MWTYLMVYAANALFLRRARFEDKWNGQKMFNLEKSVPIDQT